MNARKNFKCFTIVYSKNMNMTYRLGKIGGGSDVGEDDSGEPDCFGSFLLPS